MKLSLGKKLGLGFGVILTLMSVTSLMTYFKSARIKESQDLTFDVRYPTLETARRLQRELNQTQSKGRQAILAGGESARKEAAKKSFDQAWDEIGKDVSQLDELAPRWVLQSNRDHLTAIKQKLTALHETQTSTMDHASGERDSIVKAGNEFADHVTPITEDIKKDLGEMADSFVALLTKNKEDLHAENKSLIWTLTATTLGALGVGLFLAIFVSRDISQSAAREKQAAEREQQAANELKEKVDSILAVVAAASTGDLTQTVQVSGSDAIG